MHPFAENREESIEPLGERELIRRIRAWLGTASPEPPEGIGDDAAVVAFPSGERLILTTDPVVFGTHFDRSASPEAAAAKLLKRNLSDIAAMGGRPLAATLSLFLPETISLSWLERFHSGLAETARRYNTSINGGDICRSEALLAASLTLTGATSGRVATRRGAAPGDHLYVTGALGGSFLGHHLDFEPRLAEGNWLAQRDEVKAMMDLSDGLAKDLLELLPGGCRASIDVSALPLSKAAFEQAKQTGNTAAAHAFADGEDYELLFSLDGRTDFQRFEAEWRRQFSLELTCIGKIDTMADPGGPQIALAGSGRQELSSLHGYEHFR